MPLIADHLLDLPVEEVAWDSEGSSCAMRTRLSRVRKILGERLKETGTGRHRGSLRRPTDPPGVRCAESVTRLRWCPTCGAMGNKVSFVTHDI